jgi:DNA-binding transcriptional LysR family regulator
VAVGNVNSWVFAVAQGKVEVPARTVVRYRSMAGVANAVAAGLGLAPLPENFFEDPIFKDVLVPVLMEHPLRESTLYLVYASRKYAPLKIRAFVDFYLEVTREEPRPLRRRDLARRTAEGSESDGAPHMPGPAMPTRAA